MLKGMMRLYTLVFYFTGVLSIVLTPSPIATFKRYTSNTFTCSVDLRWTDIVITIKADTTNILGSFKNDGSTCIISVLKPDLYEASCQYSPRNFFLTIKNVTGNYQGNTLSCLVYYSDKGSRSESATARLDVQYSPTGPLSITQTPQAGIEGNNVNLSCKLSKSNPNANITWRCNGFTTVSINGNPSNNEVVSSVEKIVKKDDNDRECTCMATHVLWSNAKQKTYSLNVYYRPTVTVSLDYNKYNVVENTTNFHLPCTVTDAHPAAVSYKWYKNGSNVSTAASYNIATVRHSDTGSYTCDATNTAGRSNLSSAVQINVLYGIKIFPISRQEPIEGTVLNVTCSGQSNPEIADNNVTWSKRNNKTFMQKGQHLIINNINRTDKGTYVCSVVINLTPTLGDPINVNETTAVEVDVLYVPIVTILSKSNLYKVVENTTNFNMTCTVLEANPADVSFQWYENNSSTSITAETYTISPVQRLHAGKYVCEALNRAGRSYPSSAVQLDVLYGIEMNHINIMPPTEGKSITITCSGQSNPPMTDTDVTWTKANNDTFHEKGQNLVITNVNRVDSGTYICSVMIQLEPSFGQPVNVTGTTTVHVDVLYRPSVRVSPVFNPSLVIENNTNLQMICDATIANPAASSYKWNKDGSLIYQDHKYIIPSVQRSHAGSYTCHASNSVGVSDPSPVFNLNVLYGVSLKLSETYISVNESERLDLSCIGDGNPLPTIICVNMYNNSVVSEQKTNISSISVDHANCKDTGLYTCFGNNSIGEPVSKSADIKVACKPRSYNNLEKQNIFINGADDSLTISTTFISYPASVMIWYRELSHENLTEVSSEFNTSVISTQFSYEQIVLLQKNRLEPNDFGVYVLKASNMHGSFILTYDVISKREPDPPTNITAICKTTPIRVSWISSFNGGENQTFRIHFVNNQSNKTTYKDGIADKGMDKTINAEREYLTPNTLFWIFVEAYNMYGTAKSTELVNCTTNTNQVENQPISSAVVGGIVGSVSALLIVVMVTGVLYFWRRRKPNGGDKKLLKRHSKETDEDEDGLKANPLYVTSGEVSNATIGPVYGVVNKKRPKKENTTLDENNDKGPVYSEIYKHNIQEKKKGKGKKENKTLRNENCKDIELGTVYENSDKLSKLHPSDELYTNAGEQGQGVNIAKRCIPKKNKDGLIYADLDLVPGPNGGKFVIRGIENKTNYAMIDLSIKVDPLPSDDDEEDKDIEKAKSPAKDCSE